MKDGLSSIFEIDYIDFCEQDTHGYVESTFDDSIFFKIDYFDFPFCK